MEHLDLYTSLANIVVFIIYSVIISLSQMTSSAEASTPVNSYDNLKVLSNVQVTSGDVNKTTTAQTRSLIGCLTFCLAMPSCQSVSYKTDVRLCHANEMTMSSPGAVVSYDTAYKYIEISQRVEWHLAFRATSRIEVSVYDTWLMTDHHDVVTSVTSTTIGCLTVDGRLPCNKHLRTWRLDDWTNVAQVKHALFTDSQEVFFVTFDASGTSSSNRDEHFRISRIVASSATELVGYTGNPNYNSIEGADFVLRHFYLSTSWYGCDADYGWMFVNEGVVHGHSCSYDVDPQNIYPNFFYTKTWMHANWIDPNTVGKAQVFAVFIKYNP